MIFKPEDVVVSFGDIVCEGFTEPNTVFIPVELSASINEIHCPRYYRLVPMWALQLMIEHGYGGQSVLFECHAGQVYVTLSHAIPYVEITGTVTL